MADKVINSYLVALKPLVDKSEWKKATGDISSAIKSSKLTADEWKDKKDEFKREIESIAKLKSEIQAIEKEILRLDKMGDKASADKLRDILRKETRDKDTGEVVDVSGKYADLASMTANANNNKLLMDAMANNIDKKSMFMSKMKGFGSALSSTAGIVKTFGEKMKEAFEKAIDIIEDRTELANSLNSSGAFGSMSTRDTMAKYGVSSLRANAMTSVMGYMGISESDFGRLSSAQRKTYDELIEYYESGINKIDTTKLQEYYDILDEFQLNFTKYKIDLQNTFLKFFAESDSFKKLVKSVEKFFEKFIDFLETPVVQWFMNVGLEFLSQLIDIISGFFSVFGGASGSTVTNNSTTTKNSTNNYYIYGSDYSNNSDLARSIALEQQTGGQG